MVPCCRDENEPSVRSFQIDIHFHGWLTALTRRTGHSNGPFAFPRNRRASIKDLIESFGVPHTEVGSIQVNRQAVSFNHTIEKKLSVDIFPSHGPVNVLTPCLLRPEPLAAIRFLVDANVGKLAGKLRMAGFDTYYNPLWQDEQLADIAEKRHCILLSRDIQLLKRKKIEFGHFVRETLPARQLAEVIHFYGLLNKMNPFSRCMRCNGILTPVSKHKVLSQLEPLTQEFYHTFHRCSSCQKIYWSGSHRDVMKNDLKNLTNYLPLPE